MATFVSELGDNVAALERDALALERAAGPEAAAGLVQNLFRTAHSLKGAARAVNVPLVEAACHHLEDLLAAAREKGADDPASLCPLVLAAADALGEAGRRLKGNQPLDGSSLEQILPRLEAALTEAEMGNGARGPTGAPEGQSEPAGSPPPASGGVHPRRDAAPAVGAADLQPPADAGSVRVAAGK